MIPPIQFVLGRALTTDMAAKLKTLERENRELRQANEILRKASAYFAQAELAIH
jgi:transposase-like protein